jgi:hypothetical protein
MNAALWDPLQREALDAMGLAVYRLADAGVAAMPVSERAVAAPARAQGDTRADMPAFDDPMIAALLRAAGRARDAVDAAQLVGGWPAPSHLRRDPQAKRALWPQLRALRRPRG